MPDKQTMNLLPNEPEPLARMLIQSLSGYAETNEDNQVTIKYNEVEDVIKPYANCMVIVQELKARGELDDEEATELIEAHKERR